MTRRALLYNLACIVSAGTLSSGLEMAAQVTHPLGEPIISPVMARLSSYMSDPRLRALPGEVIEKAKQHILDTFAGMISGSELLPGRAGIQFARGYGGEKIAAVVGSDILCGPIEAALVNGVLAHSDETDDHLASAVVPAASAVGEKFGIDGDSALDIRELRAVLQRS